MDAPVQNTGTAALTGGQTRTGPAPAAAAPARVAAPRRFADARGAAAAAAARPMPQLLSEADLRTSPLLLAPPARPVRPVAVAPRVDPPKQTWSRQVREYLRRISPLQVICWQVAALAVVLTVRQPWPVLAGTSAAAAVLLALTTVRAGGRWLYELTGLAAAFATRTRRRDLPENGGIPGTTLALLDMLLPGATVRSVETSQGAAMAISHQGGLTAQLKPRALTPEMVNVLPMPGALLPAVADNAGRHHVFGVQLVLHVGVRQDKPRRLLVAVHTARTVDSPADAELTLALRNAMRRVRRALDRSGVHTEPLAEEQALSAIAGLAHVTGGRNEVREDWRFWRTGPVSQATFALTGWAALSDAQARQLVSRLLVGVPGVATTTTLGAVSGGSFRGLRDRAQRHGEPHAVAAIRLAATTEAAVEAAAKSVANLLAPSGVRLARLDGAHVHGVAASLPIGVFQQ